MKPNDSSQANYIRRIRIKNIRSIHSLEWELPNGISEPGWHVIIGDNGSGKSTFLKAIALALVGFKDAIALRQNWDEWLTRGENTSKVDVVLNTGATLPFRLQRTRSAGVEPVHESNDPDPPSIKLFAASYGPFRRFSGGSYEQQSLFRSYPNLARHLSIFGEDIALTEYLSWLQNLQFRQLEQKQKEDTLLLDKVKSFINQEGFLPYQARLSTITSEGVQFLDPEGHDLSVESLSDGYRSILSMTFELIRQLSLFFSPDQIFAQDDPTRIIAPGVILIDEVDAHLHPTWQRNIGTWFRKHFPNFQFIISTHSPLVCQAAEVGSIFRLPRPGTGDIAEMLTGKERDRLVYGNVLDAYGTESFGEAGSRSEAAQEMLQELTRLNVKEIEEGLDEDEMAQQERLRAAMPTKAYTLS